MGIPESQLEPWSHQGATTTAKSTYESIQSALSAGTSPIRYKDYDVYLQGSYRNSTNIRGDSDVDVVVQLNSTWQRELSALSTSEKANYHLSYSDATYVWNNFRTDVLNALRAYYGPSPVSEGNKSIKLDGGSSRLPADIIVCLQHRQYEYFRNTQDQSYVEGIVFYTRRDYRCVVNFPKVHYQNGVTKNKVMNTGGMYKPTVRMFKNARSRLVKEGVISSDVAPSYFVECFLYNVANDAFVGNFRARYLAVLSWLVDANFDGLMCQNEQVPLFGDTPEQWSEKSAYELLGALFELWRDW